MKEQSKPLDIVVTPEQLIGLSTIDVAKYVVRANSDIAVVHFRKYFYVLTAPPEPNEVFMPMERNAFLDGNELSNIVNSLKDEFNLTLDSRIVLRDGTAAHFQMMDLALRKSPEALEKITRRFKQIMVPRFGEGVLIETNKSYHYFGFKILNPNELRPFFGFNLLTGIVTQVDENQPTIHEQISDVRYIGHSLIRGSNCLRVTTKGTKVFEPKAIAIIS